MACEREVNLACGKSLEEKADRKIPLKKISPLLGRFTMT